MRCYLYNNHHLLYDPVGVSAFVVEPSCLSYKMETLNRTVETRKIECRLSYTQDDNGKVIFLGYN